MAYFHMKLVPPRKTFPFDGTALEMAAMAEHAAYWRAKAAARTAIVAGPVFDPAGAYGIVIVEVDDEPAARALADADPVVQATLGFAYETTPMPSLILRA
jgi:uncharacterized protein YciI